MSACPDYVTTSQQQPKLTLIDKVTKNRPLKKKEVIVFANKTLKPVDTHKHLQWLLNIVWEYFDSNVPREIKNQFTRVQTHHHHYGKENSVITVLNVESICLWALEICPELLENNFDICEITTQQGFLKPMTGHCLIELATDKLFTNMTDEHLQSSVISIKRKNKQGTVVKTVKLGWKYKNGLKKK